MHPHLYSRKSLLRTRQAEQHIQPFRVMLALDTHSTTPETLALAASQLGILTRHVDIVIAWHAGNVLACLPAFIEQLDHRGIAYRLASGEQPLSHLVTRYIERFPGVRTVLTDNLADWAEAVQPTLSRLHGQGYRFVCLSKARDHVH